MKVGAAVAEGGFRGKCYLCGEAGHIKYDCPKAKGSNSKKTLKDCVMFQSHEF